MRLAGISVDVVIAGDDDDPIPRDLEKSGQALEESTRSSEFTWQAPLRQVARTDEVERAFILIRRS